MQIPICCNSFLHICSWFHILAIHAYAAIECACSRYSDRYQALHMHSSGIHILGTMPLHSVYEYQYRKRWDYFNNQAVFFILCTQYCTREHTFIHPPTPRLHKSTPFRESIILLIGYNYCECWKSKHKLLFLLRPIIHEDILTRVERRKIFPQNFVKFFL